MKLKRISLILMITLLSLILLFCQQNEVKEEGSATEESPAVETTEEESTEEATEEESTAPETKESEAGKDNKKKDEKTIYVKQEEIGLSLEVYEEYPAENGLYQARVLFTNNSNYPLRTMEGVFRRPGKKEYLDFGASYTTMPGEESVYGYGSAIEDVEMVYINYVVYVPEEDQNYEITYNLETDKYIVKKDRITDMNYIPKEEVKVTFDNFSFDYITHPPNMLGVVSSDVSMVNHSDYKVTKMTVTYYNHDTKRPELYGLFDQEADPGEKVDFPTGFGGEEMTVIGGQYEVEAEDGLYMYQYDAKLDRYVILNYPGMFDE